MRFSPLLFLFLFILTGCGGGSSSSPDPEPPPAAVDTTPPVVTLNGPATINHEQGTTFQDPGATASDNVDGTLTVTVTGSVGNEAGTYTLTYSATDSAGNSTSVSRTVIVEDTTPPVITLIGDSTIELSLGDDFTDPGATATDTVDGSITVIVTGTVDTNVAGNYSLTYSAIDSAGNSTSISRAIRVLEAPSDILDVIQNGIASSRWDKGINAFDAALNYEQCNNDGGAACPSIAWRTVEVEDRGAVLEIEHVVNGQHAGLFIQTASPVNLNDYRNGALLFDIRTVSGEGIFTTKLDCLFPCTSGDQSISGEIGSDWQAIIVPLEEMESAGLNLSQVDTGIVIWASNHNGTIFQLDNVRFEKTYSGDSSLGRNPPPVGNVNYELTSFGMGTISDTINPASYRCVFDFGNWIYNAGVVEPGIAGCDTATGTPVGEPTPRFPQVTGPAANKPLATHRWWGSVSFHGEMTLGDPNDAAYITPDPITARITNTGFRMMGIPAGLNVYGNDFGYRIPDPFAEVFDGIAIANSDYRSLEAYAFDHSDGSVSVEWKSGGSPVMQATFVHGSPYVYIDVLAGELILKTLRSDGGEKGIYHQGTDSLGIWTSVAGNTNYFLVTGDGETQFSDVNSASISVSNPTRSYTISLMPTTSEPGNQMIADIESYARNVVSGLQIDYSVDSSTQQVEVSHQYLDSEGQLVETLAGVHPMQWKRATETINASYSVRSARGIIKYSALSSYSYQMNFVGVLPTLPTFADAFDSNTLSTLINEYIAQGPYEWNPFVDTYWSGKYYSKAAEIIALADAIGMTDEREQLLDWLQNELEDWFTAEEDGVLDTQKYFVYDDNWDTLLGMEESFAAHQQLNDHHFHYGYFVRAASEVCRHRATWCSEDQYGPMVKLLIRDYAGGRDDPLFTYLRNFDPANGFSWASGNVNFARGNNNESTSEAANAYGAMVLFGLLTNDQEILNRGIYLHASTTTAYWEYWNNIDGYNANEAEKNNFPAGYNRITTSIVWGDGAVFSTWFSAAYAHILGIQGLPSNPLTLHVGLFADYLDDYVSLGLEESSNGKPSGLVPDQWRDIWWNIWALTDPDAAIADYLTVSNYTPEAGESKAHTYHWIYTFNQLGAMAMGKGELTADYPAAMAFDRNGVKRYVVYNYGITEKSVQYSDGTIVQAQPGAFEIVVK
jgi:endoglucanase Acf2